MTHPRPSSPDDELVRRIRSGDADMFSLLFRTYWVALCTFATVMTGDADDASEIVADLFARLWERRATWVVTGSVESYLFVATRNRARSTERDARRRSDLLVENAPSGVMLHPDAITEDESAAADARVTIAQAVATLSARYRAAIYLRWERDMEYDEIAQILEISQAAAKKLVQRATAALRERVGGTSAH
jgi:RNA polymerase sigma-70 factor (ECF subfamily)